MEHPNIWCLVRINYEGDIIYKVLASYYGDAWRLSSPVSKIEMTDRIYTIRTRSNNAYIVNKNGYGMSGIAASIYSTLEKTGKAEVVNEADLSEHISGINAASS